MLLRLDGMHRPRPDHRCVDHRGLSDFSDLLLCSFENGDTSCAKYSKTSVTIAIDGLSALRRTTNDGMVLAVDSTSVDSPSRASHSMCRANVVTISKGVIPINAERQTTHERSDKRKFGLNGDRG